MSVAHPLSGDSYSTQRARESIQQGYDQLIVVRSEITARILELKTGELYGLSRVEFEQLSEKLSDLNLAVEMIRLVLQYLA